MLIRKIVRTTLGIKDHRVVSVTGNERQIVIELDKITGHKLPCSSCGKRMHVRDRLRKRQWRHVPMWNIPTFLARRGVLHLDAERIMMYFSTSRGNDEGEEHLRQQVNLVH